MQTASAREIAREKVLVYQRAVDSLRKTNEGLLRSHRSPAASDAEATDRHNTSMRAFQELLEKAKEELKQT